MPFIFLKPLNTAFCYPSLTLYTGETCFNETIFVFGIHILRYGYKLC
jgi:hypothetical protein